MSLCRTPALRVLYTQEKLAVMEENNKCKDILNCKCDSICLNLCLILTLKMMCQSLDVQTGFRCLSFKLPVCLRQRFHLCENKKQELSEVGL